jgi:hypothetical protein
MDKIKEYALITITALAFMLITGVAKSEENKVTEVINSVGDHISNEVEATKAYQVNSWAEARAQWQSLLNKFVKTESTQ